MSGIIRSIVNGFKKAFNYIYNINCNVIKFLFRLVYYTLIGGAIMLTVVIFTQWILTKFGLLVDIHLQIQWVTQPTLGQLAFQCLLIGIFEETAFRYLIMDCLLKKLLRFSWVGAVILSSAMFGLAHFNNVIPGFSPWHWVPQVIGATFIGLWLAHIYRKIGLYMAIFVHGLYDFFCFLNPSDFWISWVIVIGGTLLILLGINKLLKYLWMKEMNKQLKPYCRLFEKQ